MNTVVIDAVIQEQTKALKLPAIGREYASLSRRAGDSGWSYEEFLQELLNEELRSRQERTCPHVGCGKLASPTSRRWIRLTG